MMTVDRLRRRGDGDDEDIDIFEAEGYHDDEDSEEDEDNATNSININDNSRNSVESSVSHSCSSLKHNENKDEKEVTEYVSSKRNENSLNKYNSTPNKMPDTTDDNQSVIENEYYSDASSNDIQQIGNKDIITNQASHARGGEHLGRRDILRKARYFQHEHRLPEPDPELEVFKPTKPFRFRADEEDIISNCHSNSTTIINDNKKSANQQDKWLHDRFDQLDLKGASVSDFHHRPRHMGRGKYFGKHPYRGRGGYRRGGRGRGSSIVNQHSPLQVV